LSIIAKNLSKTFDGGKNFALKDVNLEIKQGEFIAIIGLSGAGKSTFLRAINATNPPGTGSLQVLDLEVNKISGRKLVNLRKQIGFIFQQFNLVKNLSVLQNVLVGRIAYAPLWRSLLGFFSEEDKAIAKRAIDSVGLDGRYHDKARNLSGGQQQRVAIARALVQQPKIILADEPMASLDPKLSEVIIEMLEKINKEQNITVIVNIHVLSLAKKYAKRMIAFRKGQVVFDGTPAELTDAKVDEIYHVDKKMMESL
jgi:phosphonate transport system ATP-binding protein